MLRHRCPIFSRCTKCYTATILSLVALLAMLSVSTNFQFESDGGSEKVGSAWMTVQCQDSLHTFTLLQYCKTDGLVGTKCSDYYDQNDADFPQIPAGTFKTMQQVSWLMGTAVVCLFILVLLCFHSACTLTLLPVLVGCSSAALIILCQSAAGNIANWDNSCAFGASSGYNIALVVVVLASILCSCCICFPLIFACPMFDPCMETRQGCFCNSDTGRNSSNFGQKSNVLTIIVEANASIIEKIYDQVYYRVALYQHKVERCFCAPPHKRIPELQPYSGFFEYLDWSFWAVARGCGACIVWGISILLPAECWSGGATDANKMHTNGEQVSEEHQKRHSHLHAPRALRVCREWGRGRGRSRDDVLRLQQPRCGPVQQGKDHRKVPLPPNLPRPAS